MQRFNCPRLKAGNHCGRSKEMVESLDGPTRLLRLGRLKTR
jgi:hypothetical protein